MMAKSYKTIADAEKDGFIREGNLRKEFPTLATGQVHEDVWYELEGGMYFKIMYFWGEKTRSGRPGAIATMILRSDVEKVLTRYTN